MKRRRFVVLYSGAVIAAAAVGFALLQPLIQERYFYRNPGQTAREQLNPWRHELMRPQRVVEAMHLRPGMTVLDLGSGYGFFTFALAQAVGDAGKVFATDSNPQVADFLVKQAERMAVKNIVPVAVRQFGLDPFYKTNTFDVAFACDVIPYLGNRSDEQAFLSGLSRSLKEGGRLWVLNHHLDSDFDGVEFGDWGAARDALKFPGAQTLLLKRLRPQTLATLEVEPSGQPTGPCCALLLEDLNGMLDDPTLWSDIARQFKPLQSYVNPRYQRARDYLVDKLEQAGGFAPTAQVAAQRSRPLLRLLNRLGIAEPLDI